MLKTSISLLICAATLISSTSPSIHRRQDGAVEDASQFSSKLQNNPQFHFLGEEESVKSNRNDFARILFENYKKLREEAVEESSIRSIKASELPRRKLDSGSPIGLLPEDPPTVLHLFPFHNSNSSTSPKNKTTGNDETGQTGGDRAKGPRFHYGEASSHPVTQTRAHAQESQTGGLVFPDHINEVAGPHFDQSVHHHDHFYRDHHHRHPHYEHHSPKHVGVVEHVPHYTGGHHYHDHSGLTQAVSKSLKFWLPAALLLTGASVLFPQKIKVPTNLEDIQNNRPKRSTHYEFTAGSDEEGRRFERILPAVLGREHRTHVPTSDEEGAADEYIQKSPSQYYEPHEFQRTNPEILAPKVDQQTKRKQRPQTVPKSTNNIPRRTAPVQRQNPQRDESPIIYPSRFDSGYDAFEYQKEEPIGGTGSENLYVPIPTTSSMTSTTSATSHEISGLNPKHGRKVRVLLRSRKNGTIATPTRPSGVQKDFGVEPKSKSENQKSQPKIKGPQPTKQTTLGTTTEVTKTTIAATIPTKPARISSPATPTARNPSPPVTNATRSPKSIQSQQFQPDSDLLQLLSESFQSQLAPSSSFKVNSNSNPQKLYDLSPEGPVVGLLSSVIEHKDESEACQKRALCELAIRGTNPNATRFETFMWTLATLVPDAFTTFYDLEDTFAAIRDKKCSRYACANPNLDIQE